MAAETMEDATAGVPPLPLGAGERAERLGQQARWLMVSYVALTVGALWFFHESQPKLLMALLFLTIPFLSAISVYRETERLLKELTDTPDHPVKGNLQTTRRRLQFTIGAAGTVYGMILAVVAYVALGLIVALVSYSS
ncbi:MAG: hypothetical protein VXY14_02130 [Candidatus Thermoplasmatota archaeon]|nr:hypothetical protein [Candidatus Thermoplasmatota archaeon]